MAPIIGPLMPWVKYTTAGLTLPTTLYGNTNVQSGITLGLFPSDPMATVELWRSTQSSTGVGSSSKWMRERTFGLGNNNEIVYNSVVPFSTRTLYYRGRQTRVGWINGPWSTVLGAKPTYLVNTQIVTPSFGTTALRAVRTISTADHSLVTNIVAQPQTITTSRYKARVFNSAAETLANNVVTAVTWDSELFDVGSLHSTSVSTNRITIPASNMQGLWIFTAAISFDANATGYRYLDILSANEGILGYTSMLPLTGGILTQMQVTAVLNDPAAADWIEVRALQTSGGNLNILTGGGVAGGYFDAVHVW